MAARPRPMGFGPNLFPTDPIAREALPRSPTELNARVDHRRPWRDVVTKAFDLAQSPSAANARGVRRKALERRKNPT